MILRILMFEENEQYEQELNQWQLTPIGVGISIETHILKPYIDQKDFIQYFRTKQLRGYSIMVLTKPMPAAIVHEVIKNSKDTIFLIKDKSVFDTELCSDLSENWCYISGKGLAHDLNESFMQDRSIVTRMVERLEVVYQESKDKCVVPSQNLKQIKPLAMQSKGVTQDKVEINFIDKDSKNKQVPKQVIEDDLPLVDEVHNNDSEGADNILAAELLQMSRKQKIVLDSEIGNERDSKDDKIDNFSANDETEKSNCDEIVNKDGGEEIHTIEQTEQEVSLITENEAENIEGSVHSEVGKQDDEANVSITPTNNYDFSNAQETQESFAYERTRYIQRQLFSNQKWENHKKIGVWSPIPHMGVTTFVINFATFLAENRVYTGVLEGLRKDIILKHILKRYSSSIPEGWKSFATTIHNDEVSPGAAEWIYKNVLYMPLDENDTELMWDSEKLDVYMNAPNVIDVMLVDLPNGEMAKYTLDSLIYLDELWVIVDDTFQEISAWREYMNVLKEKYNIEVKLIFNKEYDFSQADRLEKVIGVSMLEKLPSLHYEAMRNYYEKVPLLYSEGVRTKLFEPFSRLTQHVMGEDFKLLTTMDQQPIMPHEINSKRTDKIWGVFKRWLKAEE